MRRALPRDARSLQPLRQELPRSAGDVLRADHLRGKMGLGSRARAETLDRLPTTLPRLRRQRGADAHEDWKALVVGPCLGLRTNFFRMHCPLFFLSRHSVMRNLLLEAQKICTSPVLSAKMSQLASPIRRVGNDTFSCLFFFISV